MLALTELTSETDDAATLFEMAREEQDDSTIAALAEDALQRLTDVNQEIEAALAEPVEPVAWAFLHSDGTYNDPSVTEHSAGMVPLYATPPQRKPLTREEAIALWADKSDGPSNGEIVSYCRAVERAHGIT